MNLTNKTDYALHALLNVASAEGKKLCTINSISEEENIPREYLAKILKELTQLGFLKSFKGIHGGYKLAKPKGDINLLSIIEAVEGPLMISSCNWNTSQKKGFHRKGQCATTAFFGDLQGRLSRELSGMTLEMLDYGGYTPTAKGKARAKA